MRDSTPSEIQQALDQVVDPVTGPCGCLGLQGDEPYCPCAMRTVIRYRGTWVKLERADVAQKPSRKRVILQDYSVAYRVHIMAELRKAFGVSLAEAKAIMDRPKPIMIADDLWADKAEELAETLERLSGIVTVS